MTLVKDRITRLLEKGLERKKEGEGAGRIVNLARSISESENQPLPQKYSWRICNKCDTLLIPGRDARVRLRSEKSHMVIRCEKCGEVKRNGY